MMFDNKLNPYEPPGVIGELSLAEPQRYTFDVVVTEIDIQRALRRIGPSILTTIVLCIGVLLSSLLSLVMLLRGPVMTAIFLALGSLMLLAFLIRLTWMRFGLGLARQRMRVTPLCAGHFQGCITESTVTIASKFVTGVYPLQACCYAEVRGGCLVFAFDQRRLFPFFLPRHAFAPGIFERAADLLSRHARASQASPAAGMLDPRILTLPEISYVVIPDGGIKFAGPLLSQDAIATSFLDQIKRFKRAVLLMIGSLNLVVTMLAIWAFRSDAIVVTAGCVIGLLLINWFVWKVYRSNLGWTANPDQILMVSEGSISKTSIHANSGTGGTIYDWNAFVSADIHDVAISLVLPGKIGHQLVLARRQFASDADWAHAIAIVREQSYRFPITG